MHTKNSDQNVPRTSVDPVEQEKGYKDFWGEEGVFGSCFVFSTSIPYFWP